MPGTNPLGLKAYLNGTVALPKGARVKLDSGVLALAASDEQGLGVLVQSVLPNEHGTVALFGAAPGTHLCIASKAIDVGDPIYTTAAGKMTDTSAAGEFYTGVAHTAASGDGSLFEATLVLAQTAQS